jgi:hypothetical protein
VAVNQNLRRLHDAGVSIWLDTLSRRLLDSGKFAELIRDYSVTGATSNPTIFAKAITGSDLYDDQLRTLADAGERDLQELFFSLALDDVREAARLLRPEFDRTGGADGYISFECTPDLAHDTDATIAQATDLWHRIDQPNVMIKVPGTREGLPAIEELTRRGININITLLFSVQRYEEVIDAYVRGLSARADAGADRSDHLGRLVLPLADRQQGRPAAARRLAFAGAGGYCLCPRRLPAVPGEVQWRRLGAFGAAGGQAPATSVGQHRNKEPRLFRPAVRRGADRAGCHINDARADSAWVR